MNRSRPRKASIAPVLQHCQQAKKEAGAEEINPARGVLMRQNHGAGQTDAGGGEHGDDDTEFLHECQFRLWLGGA